jgi:glycerol-3-phosphate dehydrogenase
MAMFVEDYLARRSRMLFLNATAAMETAPLVASIMAKELGRDECWEKDQVAEFKEIASAYLPKV